MGVALWKKFPFRKLTAKVKAPENGCLEGDPFFLEVSGVCCWFFWWIFRHPLLLIFSLVAGFSSSRSSSSSYRTVDGLSFLFPLKSDKTFPSKRSQHLNGFTNPQSLAARTWKASTLCCWSFRWTLTQEEARQAQEEAEREMQKAAEVGHRDRTTAMDSVDKCVKRASGMIPFFFWHTSIYKKAWHHDADGCICPCYTTF